MAHFSTHRSYVKLSMPALAKARPSVGDSSESIEAQTHCDDSCQECECRCPIDFYPVTHAIGPSLERWFLFYYFGRRASPRERFEMDRKTVA